MLGEARIFHRQCGYLLLYYIKRGVIPVCPTFSDVKIDQWDLGVNLFLMVLAAVDDYCTDALFHWGCKMTFF